MRTFKRSILILLPLFFLCACGGNSNNTQGANSKSRSKNPAAQKQINLSLEMQDYNLQTTSFKTTAYNLHFSDPLKFNE